MVFWRKGGKKEELEEIKERVTGAPRPPAPPKPPEPTRVVEEKPPVKGAAPLFVKIDRYNEILKNLEEIRGMLKSFTSAVALITEIDKIKSDAVDALRKTMTKITDSLISMDEQFIRPEPMRGEIVAKPPTEVESHLAELQAELKHLRKELGAVAE